METITTVLCPLCHNQVEVYSMMAFIVGKVPHMRKVETDVGIEWVCDECARKVEVEETA